MNTDYTDSEEGNTLPAPTPADILRSLAKACAPNGNITITFEGGSKREREIAIKEAVAAAGTIIAAHPKDNYRRVMEQIAARYDVAKVQIVDDDDSDGCDDNYSVEIQLTTPLPPPPTTWRDGEWGRFPQTTAKNIAADKQPELFDAVFVQGGKTTPITLSSIEFRVLYALYAFISRPEELARDDVRRRIRNSYARGQNVSRLVPIELLARMIFDSNSHYYREVIRKALYNIATVDQHIAIGDGLYRDVPLISLGEKINRGTDRANGVVEIIFGGIFFDGLNDRYAPIYPRSLFAAWRKAGRGTELFSRLLAMLLSIYVAKKRQEAAIRKEIEQEAAKAGKTLTAADIERRVRAEVQRKKLQYTRINVETLKRKIGRDYESDKRNVADFWRDLDNAIEGQKEIGLITAASSTAATAKPGTKCKVRPRQIVFTINLDYDKAATAVAVEAEEVAAAAPRADLLPRLRDITATDDDIAEEI